MVPSFPSICGFILTNCVQEMELLEIITFNRRSIGMPTATCNSFRLGGAKNVRADSWGSVFGLSEITLELQSVVAFVEGLTSDASISPSSRELVLRFWVEQLLMTGLSLIYLILPVFYKKAPIRYCSGTLISLIKFRSFLNVVFVSVFSQAFCSFTPCWLVVTFWM